jgi:uncharacterized membrane protein
MKGWRVVSLVLTIASFAAAGYVFLLRDELLPAEVPVHWNAQFEADHYVARDQMLPYLLLTPGLMVVFMVLTPLLRWMSPRNFAVERFGRVYEYVMALVVMLMAYLNGVILWASMGGGRATGQAMMSGIFLFFVLLGKVLGQVQQNFWIGVRTPWTLASEAVWLRTHRLTGWMFVVFGLAGFLATLAGVPILYCLAGIGVIVLVPVFYSLFLYKKLEKEGKV